jgi:hypothetical protein
MFLTNKLSALETHDLVHSGTAAGAKGVEDLALAGHSGSLPKNLHRDILRKLLKNCDWPSEYYAEVPIVYKSDQTIVNVSFPFLLPHEVLYHLTTTRGMGVKRANCVEARVGERLGGHA